MLNRAIIPVGGVCFLLAAAACVSPEQMRENLTDPAVSDAVAVATNSFLSGNWIGGIVGLASAGAFIVFRKPASRYIGTAIRAVGTVAGILVKTRPLDPGTPPVPPGGPPNQSGGGGGAPIA